MKCKDLSIHCHGLKDGSSEQPIHRMNVNQITVNDAPDASLNLQGRFAEDLKMVSSGSTGSSCSYPSSH